MRTFGTVEELEAAVGVELGHSEWVEITQERIDEFAHATGDHQWIHVDPERAANGPFGSTIAHGYLTASMIPALTKQIFSITAKMAINYGINKLRFPSPVPVGSAVRATSTFVDVSKPGDAVQVVTSTVISVRGADKPAVVAEHVGRYYL